MENQLKLKSSKEVILFLAERFPQCFSIKSEVRPLKIGIFQDIIERIQDENKMSKTQLRAALRLYTSSWRYLYCIKIGVNRIDLDGNICGVLNKQHVEYARKKLEEAKLRVRTQREYLKNKKRAVFENATNQNNHDRLNTSVMPYDKNISPLHQSKVKCSDIISNISNNIDQNLLYKPFIDITTLQVGQNVKIKVGKDIVDATIIEITKDDIRVRLESGMSIIVHTEHLQA
ncbi:RNA chaperone ProQ [Candidatus Pantoea carbekii]|uniref:RNA chaperone ProQ n=1 Tax=Candidatus Pantoea carbekii TaxID=1235990 RepID=U3U6J2_9GAMM|nr:RNA chaperone ProQ [Candidatus Pantoea carbekii]AKC32047.1 ProP effector protein [Candidatus Pantoea carbekii]BAO00570.1 hypothetical protein HHS_06000 [Candidatus Pantoea carbekii]